MPAVAGRGTSLQQVSDSLPQIPVRLGLHFLVLYKMVVFHLKLMMYKWGFSQESKKVSKSPDRTNPERQGSIYLHSLILSLDHC